MDIHGKVAVVTGGAVGIGRAIAQRLAASGAEVVVADLDAAGGRETCESIGPAARFVEVDLRDDQAVADLMACQPQILVNNAGGGAVLRPCFPETSVERWSASLELVPLAMLTDTVVSFVADEALTGRVVLLDRASEAQFLN